MCFMMVSVESFYSQPDQSDPVLAYINTPILSGTIISKS